MKRRLGIVLALAVLGAAGAGVAAVGTTISLGPSGLEPSTATVPWGQTVTFTNADAAAHTIAIPRAAFTSAPIAPGGSLDYVFDGRRGGYMIQELGTRRFSGRIVVEVTGDVSLVKPPASIDYGSKLVLRGTSSILGHPVAIAELTPGTDKGWHDIASAETSSDGGFETRLAPTPGAHYRATAAAGQLVSRPVTVRVRPRIALRASARTATAGARITLRARVRPGTAASRAVLEAYEPRRKRWHRIASARTGSGGSAVFHWRVVSGRTLLRVGVPFDGLGAGYAPTTSHRIVVRGR